MSDELAKCTAIETEALALKVTTPEEQEAAVRFIQSVKAVKDEVHATFDEPIRKAHEAHKSMIEKRDMHLKPLERAERIAKTGIAQYLAAEEQKRIAIAREAQAKAEAEERKRREEEAKALKKAKQPEAAKAVLAQPLQVAIAAPPPPAKVKGMSAKKKYRVDWQRCNLALIPREYLQVNEQKVNSVVRAMGADTAIPGIVIVEEVDVSVRSAQ